MSRILVVFTVVLLAGCTVSAPRPAADPAAQQHRRVEILARRDWSLRGRVGISDGQEGGSARIRWETDGDQYELWIYAPLGQGTWRLSGDGHSATLAGPKGTFSGPNADTLLIKHLGWHLPVESLTWWVRGLVAPHAPADVTYLDQRPMLPAAIHQAGWQVAFTEWADYARFDMPRRIEAVQAPYKVKLVILDWALQTGSNKGS